MNLSKMRSGLVGVMVAGVVVSSSAAGAAEIEPGTGALPERVVSCFDDQPGGGTNVFPASAGRDGSRFSLRAGDAGVQEAPLRDMYGGRDSFVVRKMPLLIFGHEEVRVSTAPRSDGIRLRYGRDAYGNGNPGYRSIIFRPCSDRPNTLFGGAIGVKGRQPVRLRVETAGETTAHTWNLGRPGPTETEAECRRGQITRGPGPTDWRRRSVPAGPVGILRGSLKRMQRASDGTLTAKMPILVAGHRPVEIRPSLTQLDRVSLTFGRFREPSWIGTDMVRFSPCKRQPRTVWPGGIRVKGRKPVRLHVTVEGRKPFWVNLGRPGTTG